MLVHGSGSVTWWIVPLLSVAVLAASNDIQLVEAVKTQNRQAVRALIEQYVDVNRQETDGTTALHWAAH